MLAASYVLPLKASAPLDAELTPYLRRLVLGGVSYRDGRLRDAATPLRTLRRRHAGDRTGSPPKAVPPGLAHGEPREGATEDR